MLCTETAGNVYILEAAPQSMRSRDFSCSLSWVMVMKTAVSSMLILKAGYSFCLPWFVSFADISIIFLSLDADVQAKEDSNKPNWNYSEAVVRKCFLKLLKTFIYIYF